MRKYIQNACDSCAICAQYSNTAGKEPMRSLPLPTLPWQLVSHDLCEHNKRPYLVTVCHYSDWIEVAELEDTLASTIIQKTKSHFSRFGVPRFVHTDNGPQFISKDFKGFANSYGFSHSTSSPYHPKGNGRAEAAVKVAKSMLKKSTDFQAALLNYRNTPPQGHAYSLAQQMLSKRTRTLLPAANHLLVPYPVNPNTVRNDLKSRRVASKTQYDKTAGPEHVELELGDCLCPTCTNAERQGLDLWLCYQ